MARSITVGVLALQGDFVAHQRALGRLGACSREVRDASALADVDALILPGGESSTVLKLLEAEGLVDPLLAFAADKPVFGTCAGVILMARETLSPAQRSLGLLDIAVERNAYGRQVHSAVRRLEPEPEFIRRTEPGALEAVFIRAPIIRSAGPGVDVLARDEGQNPVLVEQGRLLASTFHPELSEDLRVHQLFVDMIEKVR